MHLEPVLHAVKSVENRRRACLCRRAVSVGVSVVIYMCIFFLSYCVVLRNVCGV